MRQKRERRNAVAENQERSKGNREDHVFFPCGPYRRSMRSASSGRRGAYAAPILSCLNGPACHGPSGIQRGMLQKGPQPCQTAGCLTGLRTAPLGFCLKIGEEWFGHDFPLPDWNREKDGRIRSTNLPRCLSRGPARTLQERTKPPPVCRPLSRRIRLRAFLPGGMFPEKAVRF